MACRCRVGYGPGVWNLAEPPRGPLCLSCGSDGGDLHSTASQTLSGDGLYSVGWLLMSSSRQTGSNSGFFSLMALCLCLSLSCSSGSSGVGVSAITWGAVGDRWVGRGSRLGGLMSGPASGSVSPVRRCVVSTATRIAATAIAVIIVALSIVLPRYGVSST